MGKLDLDPKYQRKSFWNLKYRLFFVDTIIRNYPCPTVFLVKDYDKNLEAIYEVVDGKQRLTTIFMFLDGEFPTDEYEAEPDISEKYFLELPRDIQRNFLDYQLTIEELNSITLTEVKEAFDRMNRNVAKLNPQELRHARYSGRFINFCESWTQNPWFQNSSICTQRRSERMSDVEFVSELVVLTAKGIQNGKEILDVIYSDYDDEIPDEAKLYADFQGILEIIKSLGLSDTSKSEFGKIVDIYSLWASIREAHIAGKTIQINESRNTLIKLSQEIDTGSSEDGKTYSTYASRQTNSLKSRQERTKIISSRFVLDNENSN